MKLLRVDTETIGLIGPVVLIQYQYEGEPIQLYNVWSEPVSKTLDLVTSFLEHHVVIYNASYDSFHLSKLFNTWRLLNDAGRQPKMNEVWEAEHYAYQGPCLRPAKCSDLYLIGQEHGLSSLYRRKPIYLRKVPQQSIAWVIKELVQVLENQLCPLLWKDERLVIKDIRHKQQGFYDLKIEFHPSSKLKSVVGYLYGTKMIEYPIPKTFMPDDKRMQYKPWGGPWREFLHYHIQWWKREGVSYATQDIMALAMLEKWLSGGTDLKVQPDRPWNINDATHTNSELAWAVGVCRQRGYPIDFDHAHSLKESLWQRKNPPTAGKALTNWLLEVCENPMEKALLKDGSNKFVLQTITELFPDSPLAYRCAEVQDCRLRKEKMELLEKLCDVNRFHPDFKVGGTASNRMSGGTSASSEGVKASGINPQGIMKSADIRSCFVLHSPTVGETLSAGDFSAQEVTVYTTVLQSRTLEDLFNQGVKIHRLLTSFAYGQRIEDVDETSVEYGRCKNGVFARMYGAEWPRLAKTVYGATDDESIEKVKKAFGELEQLVPEMRQLGERLRRDYCSMRQNNLGGKVEWHEPKPYVESIFGFRRYFDVENTICKACYDLANRCFTERGRYSDAIRVRRRYNGEDQSIMGATASALFSAAFNIQGRNLRAAGNHLIQSAGATITKALQSVIWSLQPIGINEWFVQPLNIHDEVVTPTLIPKEVETVVSATIEGLRTIVPLLSIKWKSNLKNWSEVK